MTSKTTTKAKRRFAREAKTQESTATEAVANQAPDAKTSPSKIAKPPRETKIGRVITLLERDEGATLDEMVQATGWQQHTTRAALTGLKKKGHVIERSKRDDATCYRVAETSA